MSKETATEKETTEKIYGSFLKDQILVVKPVESSGKWNNLLIKGQDMKNDPFILGKVKRSYQVPLNSHYKGGGVKIVFDNQRKVLVKKYEESFPHGMTEQEFFEKELGVDLNPRLPKDANFWRNDRRGRVILTKEGLRLDLSNSIDMLRYSILMANPSRISPSYDERKNSQSYEFMIVNEGSIVSKRIEEAEVEANAYVKFAEIIRANDKMIGFIKSLGKTVPVNYDTDWLKTEILNVLKTDVRKFLSIIEDPLFEDRIFVQEAVEAGAIKRMNNKRYTTDGGVELGDLLSTINWVNNGDNQSARLRIKSQIEMAKKK
jgi:hypothetical protein